MSSIVGHAGAGVAVYLACNRASDRTTLRALPAFVLLAVCADLDYFAIWLWHVHATPRLTHTLVFCFAASLIVWLGTRRWRQDCVANVPLAALLIASVSHPVLDLLVGAHPVPLLWPLADVSVPIGVLPSAGRLALSNFYLWRNLLIELAILVPLFAACVAIARRTPRGLLARRVAMTAPIWTVFVAWSISLQR
jgi:inner membrane protein